jgi:hypothetical protein
VLPEREDAKAVTAHDGESRDGQGLGGVALGQDERAVFGVFGPRVIGIVQLGNSCRR